MKTSFTAIFTIIIFVLLFAGTSNSQTNAKQKKDSPLKLKNKPIASTGGSCQSRSGTTNLRVTFDKSAKVTKVEMISSSSCEFFDRSAMQAARKIEFEPAIKDGEPITLVKTVVYTFRGY